MTVTVKHPFVSTVPDSADTSLVRPSNWNADHTIVGLGTAAELNAGVANGVATLDGGGTVPLSQIPASIQGTLSYQGTWNASTNTPTLASGVGTKGYYYVVSVAGSTNLDGITDWNVGDMAVYSGTAWQQIDNTDAVTSVNGYTGTVVLAVGDISGAANAPTNTNITSMTGLTGGISSPDYVQFDTAYATALTAGQLGWDGNNTLGLGMAGGNVTQHIGEDQFFYTKASSAISKGEVVMFTGAVGASGVPTGAPATGIVDGSYIMGIAAENIALNGFGLVQTFGTLRNVNTSTYADGEILWYNPAVAGGMTATKPSAPNVKVQMAAVINGGSSGGGTILIRINPGSQLGGTDSNVQIGTPTSGNTLIYDAVAGYWENANISAGTGISVTNGAGSITITNTSPSLGGDVVGPASATDNAVARYDGTTGKLIQNSAVTIGDDGATVIAANSSSAGLRITQTGAGNALLVEDSANPDSSPFAVDGSGNTGIGVLPAFANNKLSVAGSGSDASSWLARYSADVSGYEFRFLKTRSTNIYSNSVVQSGDTLGSVSFAGDDGAAYKISASIVAAVDGTPGTNDMPGRLVFSTTADGASSPTERMRIDNAGNVGIGGTPLSYETLSAAKNITGFTSARGIVSKGQIQSGVTSGADYFRTDASTQAAAFTNSFLSHFSANQGTFGAGSTVTTQFGFIVNSSLTGATNNYGFYGNIASGTGRWNFYAAGTAANYLAGGVIINNNLGVGAAGSPSYGTSGQVLTSAGSGAAPTWSNPVSSNITATGLWENAATISSNYTIASGNNAVSAGPITVASGVTVTVPSGSVWTIV